MAQNLILALSSIGLFLYALYLLEESMQEFAKRGFKKLIQYFTNRPYKSIFIGAITTALLQSSSLVSLLALSLVGAKLIDLASGIGVIFGANIGTTITSWLVAFFGFKVDIENFALPIAGVGGFLILFFNEYKKILAFAKFLLAIGLLFLALSFLKENMQVFADNFDLKEYASYGIVAMVLVGFFLTATIQSSSASMAIFLTALFSNIITFEMATALVIGANIGTTVTVIIGSIGGTQDKKRIALAHFIFNLATAAIALVLLPYLNFFIFDYLGLRDDPVIALALFHTIFNLLGVAIFSPFIPFLANYLNTVFIKEKTPLAKYITKVPTDIPEVAIEALRNEILHLYKNVLEFCLFVINIRPIDVLDDRLKIKNILEKNQDILDINYLKLYNNLKELEIMIISYANEIRAKELKEEEVKMLDDITEAVDKLAFVAKTFKDIKDDIDSFASSINEYEYAIYKHLRKSVSKFFKNLIRVIEEKEDRTEKILKVFKEIFKDYKDSLLFITKRVKEEKIDPERAATIINLNRAIFYASKNLLESANRLFLPTVELNQTLFKES